MGKVYIYDCRDYDDDTIYRIAGELFDRWNVRFSGKKVLVKPNMLGMFPPEKGVTTNPAFIRAVVRQIERRGAEKIMVGDNPGMEGYGMNEKLARITGIKEAADRYYENFSSEGIAVKIGGESYLVSRQVFDADIVVSLPRFKTHSLTLFTGAIKNMFGIIIGNDKVKGHMRHPAPDALSEFMADVCAVRPPDYSILDCLYVMEGNGPSAGKLRWVGKIIASTDPVAVDFVALKMVGVDGRSSPMISRAIKLGIGSIDELEVIGQMAFIGSFKLPMTTMVPEGIVGTVVNRIACYFISRRYPFLEAKKCSGCGICVKQCGAGALKVERGNPVVHYGRCIRCYCCMEICPQSAWKLKFKLL